MSKLLLILCVLSFVGCEEDSLSYRKNRALYHCLSVESPVQQTKCLETVSKLYARCTEADQK